MASKKRKLEVVIAGNSKGAEKAAGDTESRFSKLQGKMNDIGKKVGDAFKVIGVAAGAMFVAGALTALEQADVGSGLGASLGLSEEVAAQYGQVAGDAYAEGFGESLDEVASAVEAVHSSLGDNLDPKVLQSLTEQALGMADAFKVDMNEAVLSAGSMLKNGLAKDGQEAFDVLTVGLQGVPQAVRDEILAATNEYSKHYANLGLSGSEAIAALRSRSADGVIGVDKMGDALKELSVRVIDFQNVGISDTFQALGLDAKEMADGMAIGGDVGRQAFDKIVAGLLAVDDPAVQANHAIALFGAPLEDLGVNKIPEVLSTLSELDGGLGNVDGAARKVADQMNSGPTKAFERFKRQALQATADFIVQKLIPAVSAITDWAEENKPIVLGIAAAIGTVLVASFVAWAISAGAAAIATLAAVWPLLAIAAAVGLLVAGFLWAYDNVEWFRTGVDGLVSFITGTVVPGFMTLVAFVRDEVIPIFQKIADKVTEVKDSVGEKVSAIVGFFQGLPVLISGALSGLAEIIFGPIRTAMDWILEKVEDAVGKLQSALDTVRGVGRVGGFDGSGFAGIPKSHSGSVIPGGAADEVLRVLQGGEIVLDRGTVQRLASGPTSGSASPSGGGATYITVHVAGSVRADRDLAEVIVDEINRQQRRSARPMLPGVA